MRTPGWVALAIIAVLSWTAATPLLAQETTTSDVARAESYAAAGFEAYERKEYAEAVTLYKQALEAAPSADIVYNLARIHDTKLKDRKLAIEYYRRYTLDTGADPNRLRTASLRLAELGELEAVASESPARRESASEPRAPPPLYGTTPKAVDDGGLSGVQIAGIVTGGAGLVGIGIGVGFGLEAKSDADVAHDLCDGNDCRTQRGVDAAKSASRAATVSTISFIAGGVLAALGVTFLIAGGEGGTERQTAGVSVAPYAEAGAIGANFEARF
jgi:tetratricopeptide (TPR) repeat protein